MDLDDATRLATAFGCFQDLLTTCYTGYAPTLTPAVTEDLPRRVAKSMLARELKRRALAVRD
jgi:hypothetical protein